MGGQCPWEVLHGKRVPEGAFNWIRTFGARAYVILPESGRIGRKLAGRTEPMLYVGMGSNGNSYLMYNPKTKRFLETREAIFDERILGLPGEEKKYGVEEPTLLGDEEGHVEETRAPVRQPEKQQAVENERESSPVRVEGQRVATVTTLLRSSPCSVRQEMAQEKGMAVVKQLFSEENQHVQPVEQMGEIEKEEGNVVPASEKVVAASSPVRKATPVKKASLVKQRLMTRMVKPPKAMSHEKPGGGTIDVQIAKSY